MECPHCRSEITANPHAFALGEDKDGAWQVSSIRCATCDHLVVRLGNKNKPDELYPILPQGACRARLSTDIPVEWSDDYHTACRVLPHSPEASAAISRRLLHRVLAVKTAAGHGSLSDQIRQAVISSDLPPYLKEALQTLTRVAKLDSDSPKSERPEALAPVEPGEPEWLLDILQSMFDLYFVLPAKMERRRDALEKLMAPEAATPPADPAPAGLSPAAGATAASAPATPTAGPTSPGGQDAPHPGVSGSVSI